ncbi:MAG: carbohydrate ABC transporter permease [Candidatus Hadarchaeum sp.]|uniref:carbohydrate ABC transporter permease n=1 Tax=Candidatus Hadarchaeum sp. TaxID=2883567 RepID=UPI00316BF882
MCECQRNIRVTLFYVLLLLCAVIIALPYAMMVLTGFKTPGEVFAREWRLLPRNWRIENYVKIIEMPFFRQYLMNSIIVTAGGVLLEVVVSFLAAYGFARLSFPGKQALFFMVIATMMIPPQVLMLPQYIVVHKLGWVNKYAGLIIPRAASAFGVFLLRQFFLSIPRDYEDAARVDGCGLFRLLTKVYLPMVRPAVVTLAVFSFLGFWNDYYWPLIITNRDEMRTLPLGIAQFMSVEGMGQWHLLMAAATIATVPSLLVFLIARRQVISNITAGGLKG